MAPNPDFEVHYRKREITAEWVNKFRPDVAAELKSEALTEHQRDPTVLREIGTALTAARCEGDEARAKDLDGASAEQLKERLSQARFEAADAERKRIFAILAVPESNPAGVTNDVSQEFMAQVLQWASDPAITLEDATARYGEMSRAYDNAARASGLAALAADERDLDLPMFLDTERDDSAASIKAAGDYASQMGKLNVHGSRERP